MNTAELEEDPLTKASRRAKVKPVDTSPKRPELKAKVSGPRERGLSRGEIGILKPDGTVPLVGTAGQLRTKQVLDGETVMLRVPVVLLPLRPRSKLTTIRRRRNGAKNRVVRTRRITS